MFVYFLISVILHYRVVDAAPILIERADAAIHRTLFAIIWSCLSTTIICAWTSVHPNVPPPNRWKARWNRLMLMFWMIIAPELVLAWAVRQFFAASEIRDIYNGRHPDIPRWKKWSLKHGHLLQMGGFRLIDPDQKGAELDEPGGIVLTMDYFKENPKIDSHIPEITAADIEDRSKGDALTKIIAILQTTWFIIQCITRGVQELALTELELVTLALASLNAVTFAIWWHKPLGVQEPVRIYWKIGAVSVESGARQGENQAPEISFQDVMSRAWGYIKESIPDVRQFLSNPCEDGPFAFLVILSLSLPTRVFYIVTSSIFVLFALGILFLLRINRTEPISEDTSKPRGFLAARIIVSLQKFRYWLTSVAGDFFENQLRNVFSVDLSFITFFVFNWFLLLPLLFFALFVILLIPFFAPLFLVSFIFTAVLGIVTTSSIRNGAAHVPSFYAPTTTSDGWSRMIVFALFGVIFGGLHCIGWHFNFPTHSEQSLWRYTSLAITVIPLIVAPIDFLLASRLGTRNIHSCGTLERVTLLSLDLVMTILLFVYVPVRLSLIAQALALLRSLPPSALTAVDWTRYIPHLFSS